MKIQQLSIFLENRPGHLGAICRTLAKENLNILTLSLADTQQFGILRLIIREWEKARDILEREGFVVTVNEVVAIEVEDRPGGVAGILEVIESGRINIEYMYAFTFRRGDKAVLVFRFDNPDKAAALLQKQGLSVLGGVDLYRRTED